MSEVMNDAGSPVTEAELLGIIGRQQESIFHADHLIGTRGIKVSVRERDKRRDWGVVK